MNKVILVGRMGKDPEVKTTEKTTIANFTLATKEYNDGTEWHNIVAFGKTAEVVERFTSKGSQVGVEGRLQTRSWENNEGERRWTTEIVVERLELLGSKEQKEEPAPAGVGEGEDDLTF